MSADRFDVVIVGGGAVGSAVAYFLTCDATFTGTVAVVERDPTYARASTTLSAASIRQQFSTPENIRMSRFGVAFIKDFAARFGDGDIGFRENGYLLLAGDDGRQTLQVNHQVQRAEGADITLLERPQLAQRFPWMTVDDVAAGALGLSGEGWFDAHALLSGLRKAARDGGATYVHGEVVGIGLDDNRVSDVTLADGRRLACGVVVNAAGPQAGDVAALAHLALPVEPRKRCVFVVVCRADLAGMPLIVDKTGVWIRPEGGVFLCGVSPAPDADPRADGDFVVDETLFEDSVWPALARRIPAMEELKLLRAWAGHYDFNTFDQNAILGAHPDVHNFLFANGFSGHGVQQAAAAGRAIAELIVDGCYTSLDLTRLSYARIAAGKPLREVNVI